MKENDKKINIAVAMELLYIKANKYVYITYFIQILFFIVNLILIVVSPRETSLLIWSILGGNIGVIIVIFALGNKSKYFYFLGEELRKMDIITKIFPKVNNRAEESYLKGKLPLKILQIATEGAQGKTEYYSDQKNKYSRLIEHIQENCFWTSSLMGIYAKQVQFVLFLIISIFVISILYGFNRLSEDNGPEAIKNVASYLALFVNFIFTLNIYSHLKSFERKAAMLKKIDKNLEVKKIAPSEDDVINIFTEYNCILTDALPYPDWVYKKNQKNLNAIWKDRVDKN